MTSKPEFAPTESASDTRIDAPFRRRGETPLRARDFVYATAIVAAATALGYFWIVHLWPHKIAMLLLAAVLLTGYLLGMWPALFAALLAYFASNFFFEEPRFTLTMNAEDAFALTMLLVGALLVGGLTGRLRDHTRRLKYALMEMTSLFETSRDLAVTLDPKSAAEHVVRHLERNDCHAAVWMLEDGKPTLSAASAALAANTLADVGQHVAEDAPDDEITPAHTLMRLSAGGRQVGVAAVWAAHKRGLPDSRWTRALLDLAAVAIDRARLIAEIATARMVAEKEGLRTALLSSLSHDLRTPLSTILASATSLLEYEERFDAATRRDLLVAIQEESERLNRYLANLLEMTRLESGALQVGRSLIDPREAMAAALRRMNRKLVGRHVERSFAMQCANIEVDPVLIEQALMNVIENAAVHAPPATPIVASVQAVGTCVRLSIEDLGEGIIAGDLPYVFEKFFRGGGDRKRGSGVGLGLAVTRGLIEAFGGSVRAVSPVRDDKGTRIEIDLPAHRMEQPGE
jgi:two-component system sensor histidine kinase KdpD